jgi:hypothetical protein
VFHADKGIQGRVYPACQLLHGCPVCIHGLASLLWLATCAHMARAWVNGAAESCTVMYYCTRVPERSMNTHATTSSAGGH